MVCSSKRPFHFVRSVSMEINHRFFCILGIYTFHAPAWMAASRASLNLWLSSFGREHIIHSKSLQEQARGATICACDQHRHHLAGREATCHA